MIFSEGDHIEQIKAGTKTQTRRTSDRYEVGKLYVVQPCRTCKGIPDGKILIRAKIIEINHPDPKWGWIMADDAEAEGGYTPEEYEKLYNEMHPHWEKRYAYLFNYYTTEEIKLMEAGNLDEAFALAMSRTSQQLRKTSVSRSESAEHPDTGEADTQPVPASSGREKGGKKEK